MRGCSSIAVGLGITQIKQCLFDRGFTLGQRGYNQRGLNRINAIQQSDRILQKLRQLRVNGVEWIGLQPIKNIEPDIDADLKECQIRRSRHNKFQSSLLTDPRKTRGPTMKGKQPGIVMNYPQQPHAEY